MPRIAGVSPGGMLFHVLNRGVGRIQIFRAEEDYDAFHRLVEQARRVAPIRIRAYCWVPNPRPSDWTEYVNSRQTEAELEARMARIGANHERYAREFPEFCK